MSQSPIEQVPSSNSGSHPNSDRGSNNSNRSSGSNPGLQRQTSDMGQEDNWVNNNNFDHDSGAAPLLKQDTTIIGSIENQAKRNTFAMTHTAGEATDGLDKLYAIVGNLLTAPKLDRTQLMLILPNVLGAFMFGITPMKEITSHEYAHIRFLGHEFNPLYIGGFINLPLAITFAFSSVLLNAGVNVMTGKASAELINGRTPYEKQAFAVKSMSNWDRFQITIDSISSVLPYIALYTPGIAYAAWVGNAGLGFGIFSLLLQSITSQMLKLGVNPKIKVEDALQSKDESFKPHEKDQEMAYHRDVMERSQALFLSIIKHAEDQVLTADSAMLKKLFEKDLTTSDLMAIISKRANENLNLLPLEQKQLGKLFKTHYTSRDFTDENKQNFLFAAQILNRQDFDEELVKGLLGEYDDPSAWYDKIYNSLPSYMPLPPKLKENFRKSISAFEFGLSEDQKQNYHNELKKALKTCYKKGFNTNETFNYVLAEVFHGYQYDSAFKNKLKQFLYLRRDLLAVKDAVDQERGNRLAMAAMHLAFAADKPHTGTIPRAPEGWVSIAKTVGAFFGNIGFAPNSGVGFFETNKLNATIAAIFGVWLGIPKPILVTFGLIFAWRSLAANMPLSGKMGGESFEGMAEMIKVLFSKDKNVKDFLKENPAFYAHFWTTLLLVSGLGLLAPFTFLTGFKFALETAKEMELMQDFLGPLLETILGWAGSTGNVLFNFLSSKVVVCAFIMYYTLRGVFKDAAKANTTDDLEAQKADPKQEKVERLFFKQAIEKLRDILGKKVSEARRFQMLVSLLKQLVADAPADNDKEKELKAQAQEAILRAEKEMQHSPDNNNDQSQANNNNNNAGAVDEKITSATADLIKVFTRLAPATEQNTGAVANPLAVYEAIDKKLSDAHRTVYQTEEKERYVYTPPKSWGQLYSEYKDSFSQTRFARFFSSSSSNGSNASTPIISGPTPNGYGAFDDGQHSGAFTHANLRKPDNMNVADSEVEAKSCCVVM